MPVYEYACRDCGCFSAMRPMVERDAPAACPNCGATVPRVLSAPRLALVPPGVRRAHETNERSANAPLTDRAYGGGHPQGCGCGCGKRAPAGVRRAGAAQRPWMLSH
ncbi:zinc ribbon domain-containing protein [Salinisphaera sp.]|uniref:FmdB family zinc ribbon protein n=1 Tax=Salinisphaera sp. TaxID=1914330 RepID=UPI002D77237C|nr:zinc ribbon domain-containing protein [Salinisphaera sp.]HET7315201.1 zinc ribbon domain-containing protein [Salinisphaera sp.]